MVQQYLAVKEQHKNELLFFRLGDFYEMFFEDALTASRELNITLTKRAGSGDPEKIQKALEETKDLKVGTGTITMDKNHTPIKQAVILQNKDGDRVMVAKIMPDSED